MASVYFFFLFDRVVHRSADNLISLGKPLAKHRFSYGRTFVESHRAIASGFENAVFVTVNRGGHNLFMNSPEILTTMKAFYSGEKLGDFTIDLTKIRFL